MQNIKEYAKAKDILIHKFLNSSAKNNPQLRVVLLQFGHEASYKDKIKDLSNELTEDKIKNQIIIYPENTSEAEISYLIKYLEADFSIIGYIFLDKDFAIDYESEKNLSKYFVEQHDNVQQNNDLSKSADKYSNLKMQEVQTLLRENNIKFKFGSSKADLIKLLIENNI